MQAWGALPSQDPLSSQATSQMEAPRGSQGALPMPPAMSGVKARVPGGRAAPYPRGLESRAEKGSAPSSSLLPRAWLGKGLWAVTRARLELSPEPQRGWGQRTGAWTPATPPRGERVEGTGRRERAGQARGIDTCPAHAPALGCVQAPATWRGWEEARESRRKRQEASTARKREGKTTQALGLREQKKNPG